METNTDPTATDVELAPVSCLTPFSSWWLSVRLCVQSGSKASIHNGTAKGPWQGQGVKTVICHQWASRGRCDYGTACKFAHQRLPGGGGDRIWNESALDEKKLLAAMLSGLSPQEALSQALNSLQNSNPQKFGGPVQGGAAGAQQQGAPAQGATVGAAAASAGNTPTQTGGQAQAAQQGAGSTNGSASQEDPNSPTQQGQVGGQLDQAQMAGVLNAMNGGQQLVPPTKRADGSLILCRFFARHGCQTTRGETTRGQSRDGWACVHGYQHSLACSLFLPPLPVCKYGVACKFHHQPNPHGQGPPMFPPGPYGPMSGGPPNQSLASLLALGLKASMMSNDHLIANHAALLAAHMNNPGAGGQQGPPGAGGPPRMGSPGPMGGQGMPPLDPQLANVLAAYLGQQQPQNPNIAALLQQLQGGGPNTGGSISPTQLQGFDGGFLGHQQGQDAAFQAYMQHQQQQQNAFGFSPAAANAFNAIPNLNTTPAGANGAAAGGPGGAGQPNLSLPQMISTAFRSTSGGVNGPSGGSASGLSNNLSLMSLKPFADDATSGDSLGGGHQRSNSNSFNTESGSSFSSPSLLANERAYNDYSGGGSMQGQSSSVGASGSQIIGPASLNGSPNAGSLSALFSSSSLNGPFLH